MGKMFIKNVSWLLILIFLSACSSTPKTSGGANEAGEEAESLSRFDQQDKFERYNRAVFNFNLTIDRWFLKPIAKGYDKVLPRPVKTGIGNFFDNLGEVTNVLNDILQWKWKRAGLDASRFAINSTLGIVGIFDVAKTFGIEESDGEDFAQTLAVWGVPQGSYLVIPFLGSSSLRGIGGFGVDWVTDPLNMIEDEELSLGLIALEVVHDRSELLTIEELATGDFYLFVRDAYLQRREYLVKDGEVEDVFGDDFDEDFDEDWGEDEAF